MDDQRQDTTTSLIELLELLGGNEQFTYSRKWKMLVSIDEVHTLLPDKFTEKGRKELEFVKKHKLDYLLQAMNELRAYPVFFILLSTQSDMSHLAPSTHLARSMRYGDAAKDLLPPITETPFDCIRQIRMTRVKLEMISDPVWMAMYGRPL